MNFNPKLYTHWITEQQGCGDNLGHQPKREVRPAEVTAVTSVTCLFCLPPTQAMGLRGSPGCPLALRRWRPGGCGHPI